MLSYQGERDVKQYLLWGRACTGHMVCLNEVRRGLWHHICMCTLARTTGCP